MQAFKLDKNVFIFGQAVDKTGHVFHTTEGILKKYGKKRIFDTPNSEQAETMFAAGAANYGLRPILIHPRVDFMAYSFEYISRFNIIVFAYIYQLTLIITRCIVFCFCVYHRYNASFVA